MENDFSQLTHENVVRYYDAWIETIPAAEEPGEISTALYFLPFSVFLSFFSFSFYLFSFSFFTEFFVYSFPKSHNTHQYVRCRNQKSSEEGPGEQHGRGTGQAGAGGQARVVHLGGARAEGSRLLGLGGGGRR